MNKFLLYGFVLCLSACSTGISVDKYNDRPSRPDGFSLCHGYSCTSQTGTSFLVAEWNNIASLFQKNTAKNVEEERSKIGQAIAMMERYAGAKTGTDIDEPEAVSFKSSTKQMDCIDETVNTTHYLEMLYRGGLLKFYEPAEPTHRGYLIDGSWPHNTAVMKEKDSGVLYVVDSFYKKNGEVPYIMSRETWLAGWKPAGSRQ